MHAGHRRGPRRSSPPADPVTALLDKGDGHGTDWPNAAAALFKAAFSCLDEAKGDARALTVARRVQDGAYNRMVGTSDSELPYTADRPEEPPPLMPEAGPQPDFEMHP